MMAAAAWLLTSPAVAGDTILRAPAPEWLPAVAPHLSNTPDDVSQHIRYELAESHVRNFGTHNESYIRMRIKILSSLGLQHGSQLGMEWNPALQTPTVHHARIIRAGETIELLDKVDFTVLRREAGLESSLQINGVLTGVLLAPDVRVGDVIDFAYSVRTQFDVFGNPLELQNVPVSPIPLDLAVTTISWPSTLRVQTRAGAHATLPPIQEANGIKVMTMRLTDVQAETFPETISAYSIPDYGWQISSIPQWGSIVDYIRPAYQQAIAMPAADDLAAQVARIKSEHATPEARAVAALRLVQDEVRYLAIALGDGGWLPTSASDVWASRQGDCKGKTVLLVAILKELGIDAVPVLVSSENLPLDKYLPMVGAFDHVIVKARINGETYLMDGTRIGDRSLTPDKPIVHDYVLPIVERARLENIPVRVPSQAKPGLQIEIDFSDGVYSPARVTLTDYERGNSATEMHAGISAVPHSELTRWYDERWNKFLKDFGQVSDVKSQWEYREATHEFIASATARVAFDWSNGPVNIPLAHVTWKGLDEHSGERFKDALYTTSFPSTSSFQTTIILPEEDDALELTVEPYEVEAGATRYFRTVRRNGNRLETDRGSIALRPYMTPAERALEQSRMDSFNTLKATMRLRRGYTMTAADRATLTAAPADNPESALRRGYALHSAGDYAGAIAQFDAAIAGFSTPHANALANRALAYLSLNEIDKARADISAAEAVDPNETILFHAKGRLAESEEDDLDALLAFTGAINAWPENTYALYRRAAAYERMGQTARALADLERVVTIKPQDIEAKGAVAGLLLRMGRPQQSLEQTALIAEALGYPDAKISLFIDMAQRFASELKAKDPAKAEAILTDALSVESDFPALMIDRALIRDMRGDARGATADRTRFKQLTQIDLNNSAQACTSKRLISYSRAAALDACDKAITQTTDDADLHVRRGYLLYVNNQATEAVTAYRTALDLAPGNQKARYGLGMMLNETGQATEGAALMAEALAADPDANADFDNGELIMVRAD